MKYLNTRTGNVIDVPCRLEGPDWKEITEAKTAAPVKETKPAAKAPAKAVPKKRTAREGADA